MSPATFTAGVVIAVLAAVAGAAASAVLGHSPTAYRLVVALLAGGYVLYLLWTSDAKVGRVVAGVLLCTGSALAWLAEVPLGLFLFAHLGAIWLVRSCYFATSVPSALLDLGLIVLGAAGAAWAIERTQSPGLAIWTFFLVQSMFVFIPTAARTRRPASEDAYQSARRAAIAAVRKMGAV
ncbi:MAG: hypothetical protein OXI79_12870 [Gammaproteobacteria bacterium]|nr:hypothetical protein [Gammaproteobacteria bacterium]